VKVHYHGTLRDGMVFDSTIATGTPATFPLDRVIPCWQEGIVRMKVGGKSQLVCPPQIAYGDQGFPPAIPGGAALEFEVELVDVVR
jgi:FKBP-type peptidyl-prolyl cis-trans isomerase FkpA